SEMGLPSSGRPRCDITMTRAPASSARRRVGIVAWMRVSLPTTPSFTGTLRSSRINTRLPARSRSCNRFTVIVSVLPLWCIQLPDCFCHIQHTIGKCPLIIEPYEHFDQPCAADPGLAEIDDRRTGIMIEVAGGQGLIGAIQHQRNRVPGPFTQRGLDGIRAGIGVQGYRQIDGRDVDGGYAHRLRRESAFQVRKDATNALVELGID